MTSGASEMTSEISAPLVKMTSSRNEKKTDITLS